MVQPKPAPEAIRAENEKQSETAQKGETIVTGVQLSQLLQIGEERIRQLQRAGWLPKRGPGQYPLVGAVRGYLAYKDSIIEGMRKTAAEGRVITARAEQLQLRNAKEKGQVCPVGACFDMVDEWTGVVRTEIEAIPARFTRDLDERERLERECAGALNRIADFAASYELPGEGRTRPAPKAKARPRRVGKRKSRAAA